MLHETSSAMYRSRKIWFQKNLFHVHFSNFPLIFFLLLYVHLALCALFQAENYHVFYVSCHMIKKNIFMCHNQKKKVLTWKKLLCKHTNTMAMSTTRKRNWEEKWQQQKQWVVIHNFRLSPPQHPLPKKLYFLSSLFSGCYVHTFIHKVSFPFILYAHISKRLICFLFSLLFLMLRKKIGEHLKG